MCKRSNKSYPVFFLSSTQRTLNFPDKNVGEVFEILDYLEDNQEKDNIEDSYNNRQNFGKYRIYPTMATRYKTNSLKALKTTNKPESTSTTTMLSSTTEDSSLNLDSLFNTFPEMSMTQIISLPGIFIILLIICFYLVLIIKLGCEDDL